LLLSQQVWAQRAGSFASASIDSRLGFNVNSRLGGREDPWWSTEVTPGIRLQSNSGRVVGSLDYGLVLAAQSRGDVRSEVGNRLTASFSADVVDQRFFLDGRASISKQSATAISTQYAANSSSALFDTESRAEVATFSLSPSVRGVIGAAVTYDFRLTADATDRRGSSVGDQQRMGGSVTLSSAVRGTMLTWALNATTSETEFRTGRTTRSESTTASLGWLPDPDFTFSVRGGTERQDVDSSGPRSTNTWGAGATWRPSNRTRVQVNYLDRYFGTGWSGVAEYRFARTAFSFSTTRDTSDGFGTSFAPVTQFQAFMSLFAREIPDSAARESFVRALLASENIDPNDIAVPGFVTGAVSLNERNQLGVVRTGQRLSLSLQAFRTVNRVIDTFVPELSRAPVRQSGYVGSASYRLTPRSSIVLSGTRQMTRSIALPEGTDLKSLSLSLTNRPGQATTLTMSARYSVFNSPVDPYREASIQAALGHRF
jgi:uncharacterized protein (PEP-CTERM system associated)